MFSGLLGSYGTGKYSEGDVIQLLDKAGNVKEYYTITMVGSSSYMFTKNKGENKYTCTITEFENQLDKVISSGDVLLNVVYKDSSKTTTETTYSVGDTIILQSNVDKSTIAKFEITAVDSDKKVYTILGYDAKGNTETATMAFSVFKIYLNTAKVVTNSTIVVKKKSSNLVYWVVGGVLVLGVVYLMNKK